MAEDEVDGLASNITHVALDILREANEADGHIVFDVENVLSDERVRQVAKYALRDLKRLEVDQNSKVAITKYVGYIGFWFSKLKPIKVLYRLSANGDETQTEIADINESLAVYLMNVFFWALTRADPRLYPPEWKECPVPECLYEHEGKQVRGLCLRRKMNGFHLAYNRRLFHYLVYALRYRAEGPYFLVNYLEEAIFFSCEHTSPPIGAGQKVA